MDSFYKIDNIQLFLKKRHGLFCIIISFSLFLFKISGAVKYGLLVKLYKDFNEELISLTMKTSKILILIFLIFVEILVMFKSLWTIFDLQ